MTVNVVSGLLKKREDLLKEQEHYNGEALRIGAAIAAVESTIRLYDPSYAPTITVTRRTSRENRYFQTGEAVSLIFDYMREHSPNGPVANTDIIKHIGALKGISRDAVEEHQYQAFYNSVAKCIKRLRDNGKLKESHREKAVIFWVMP